MLKEGDIMKINNLECFGREKDGIEEIHVVNNFKAKDYEKKQFNKKKFKAMCGKDMKDFEIYNCTLEDVNCSKCREELIKGGRGIYL